MIGEVASFRRVDRPEAVCLVVHGEIDLADIPRFHREAAALIADARAPVVIDLRGVTFFNSSSIGALITAQQEAEKHGAQLVVETSPAAYRVLEITGLAHHFDVRVAD